MDSFLDENRKEEKESLKSDLAAEIKSDIYEKTYSNICGIAKEKKEEIKSLTGKSLFSYKFEVTQQKYSAYLTKYGSNASRISIVKRYDFQRNYYAFRSGTPMRVFNGIQSIERDRKSVRVGKEC